MAIIVTGSAGSPRHGDIIAMARNHWWSSEEYANHSLAVVLFDLNEDEEPIEIVDFGSPESKEFDTPKGKVVSDNVYRNSTIFKKKIEVI